MRPPAPQLLGSCTLALAFAACGRDEPPSVTRGREVCERYIECTSVTIPNELPDVQHGFGADSECWTEVDKAELCERACQTGIEQSHEAFPDEPLCGLCLTDAECGEGNQCHEGDCVPEGCGDGVVQPGELCDGQDGCSLDCRGGAVCSPLNNVGCASGAVCVLLPPDLAKSRCLDVEAFDDEIVFGGAGEACGEDPDDPMKFHACDVGLACVDEYDTFVSCEDLPNGGCCVAYCDVNAPACPSGYNCIPYDEYWSVHGPLEETALGYLGYCEP